MADLADALLLYLRSVRVRLRAQLQYPASLALESLGMLGAALVDFAAIAIIFANVPHLADWTLYEVALLYGISTIAFSLTDIVLGHTDTQLSELIRRGDFDSYLTRPRSTLLQLVAADFQVRRVGKLVQGALVLAFALSQLDIAWTADRLALLVAAPLAGAAIFGAVWIVAICVAFWAVEGREIANAFTYGGQTLAQYPVTIYERWLRQFLAFVVPTAFVAYFPALHLLGRPDPLGLPAVLQIASPVVAVAALLVAAAVWSFSVRRYQSAGG